MVQLYVDGQRIASWADGEAKVAEYAALGKEIELRNDAGIPFSRLVPSVPLCPWDATLTKDKIETMCRQGGGSTIAEFWQRKGVE